MKSIFVSSTFSDMQAERDMVQELVAPVLRREAKNYGDYVEVVDLRWGVDTTDMDSTESICKVASTCLNEVKRCQPYMLVFLGERYGSTVQYETLKRVVDFGENEYDDSDSISLTAMEIEYGAFLNNGCDITKCVFCIREEVSGGIASEEYRKLYGERNADYQRKLELLKDKIRKSTGNCVIEYTAVWDDREKKLTDLQTLDGKSLSERLVEMFRGIFISDWENYAKISWQDKEQMAANTLAERHLRAFRGREALIEECLRRIEEHTGVYVIKGAMGCGKTSVMCKLAQELKEKRPETPIFLFFSKASVHSDSVRELMRQIVYFLEKHLGITKHYEERVREKDNEISVLQNRLQELQNQINIFQKQKAVANLEDEEVDEEDIAEDIAETKRILFRREKKYADLNRFRSWKSEMVRLANMLTEEVYLFVDAIDLLEKDKHVNSLAFTMQHKRIHFVISYNRDFLLYDLEQEITEEEIALLDDGDIQKVIQGIFKSYSKEVYIQVISEIKKKNNAARNPFYLSMIMQRLNMMNTSNLSNKSEGEIIEQSCRIVRELPENIGELVTLIVGEAIERNGSHKETLWDIVNLIAVTQNGIGEKDLYAILSTRDKYFNRMELAQLTDGLDGIFIRYEDGRLDFSSDAIREGIRHQMRNVPFYTNMVVELIKSMEEENPLRYTEGMRFARMVDDGELANKLIIDSVSKGSFDKISKLSHSIVWEAIEDNGAFYLRHLEEWWNASNKKKIRKYFLTKFGSDCNEVLLARKHYFAVAVGVLSLLEKDVNVDDKTVMEMQSNVLWIVLNDENAYDSCDGVRELCTKMISKVLSYVYSKYGLDEEQLSDVGEYIQKLPVYKRECTTRDLEHRIELLIKIYYEIAKDYGRKGMVFEGKNYYDKANRMRVAFEKEVDKRRYKKTAEESYSDGTVAFTGGLWENAVEEFKRALKYWENSYENTGNKQTLWTLYQKSNEIGVMFFREGRKAEAQFFLQASRKYAGMKVFGTNETANRRAINMAEQNLRAVL